MAMGKPKKARQGVVSFASASSSPFGPGNRNLRGKRSALA
jgi:hypothetical protein